MYLIVKATRCDSPRDNMGMGFSSARGRDIGTRNLKHFQRKVPMCVVSMCICCSVLLALPVGGLAYVRSASEDHFPHVWDSQSKRAVVWVRGSLLQRVLGATAVRVTDNRIRFVPAGWTLLAWSHPSEALTESANEKGVIAFTETEALAESESKQDVPHVALQPVVPLRHDAMCKPHMHALCRVESHTLRDTMGVGEGSLIFPTADTSVVVHGNTSHACKNGRGRTSVAAVASESVFVYDISVCDVVEGSLDVLFIHDTVQVVHIDMNSTLYVITALLVVLMVVLVTQNLAFDVITDVHGDSKEPAVSTGTCISLALSLAFSSCVLPGLITGGVPGLFVALITVLDLYYFAVLVLYISLHCLLWACGHIHARLKARRDHSMMSQASFQRVGQLHSVNIMVCSLLLTVCSTHGTIETVLTMPLLFLFTFRTIFKCYAIENSSLSVAGSSDTYKQTVFEPLLVAFDIVVVGSTHVVGTSVLAETDIHSSSEFVIMFVIAHTLAYEGNRARRPKPP